jgi:hypothetical protein
MNRPKLYEENGKFLFKITKPTYFVLLQTKYDRFQSEDPYVTIIEDSKSLAKTKKAIYDMLNYESRFTDRDDILNQPHQTVKFEDLLWADIKLPKSKPFGLVSKCGDIFDYHVNGGWNGRAYRSADVFLLRAGTYNLEEIVVNMPVAIAEKLIDYVDSIYFSHRGGLAFAIDSWVDNNGFDDEECEYWDSSDYSHCFSVMYCRDLAKVVHSLTLTSVGDKIIIDDMVIDNFDD